MTSPSDSVFNGEDDEAEQQDKYGRAGRLDVAPDGYAFATVAYVDRPDNDVDLGGHGMATAVVWEDRDTPAETVTVDCSEPLDQQLDAELGGD